MIDFNEKSLTIIFWDVQHGNAIYIKTPNGTQIIQDLGIGAYSGNSSNFSPLNYLQNKYGVKYLDQVIISHPDLDHLSDILNLKNFSFLRFSRPHGISNSEIEEKLNESNDNYHKEIFRKYIELTKQYKDPVNPKMDPTLPNNNGGVRIKLFYPEPDIKSKRINNHSLVTVLSYASSKIILTGDNEEPSWKYLLDDSEFIEEINGADIFLASHHGRQNGYYANLFKHFRPNLTIVSDGHICDTSATSRYSSISEGWTVHKKIEQKNRAYEDIERSCLTTRKDGVIIVKMGYSSNNKPYLDLRI
jgi:competence protein ComEC